jgi:hypothetical protein
LGGGGRVPISDTSFRAICPNCIACYRVLSRVFLWVKLLHNIV